MTIQTPEKIHRYKKLLIFRKCPPEFSKASQMMSYVQNTKFYKNSLKIDFFIFSQKCQKWVPAYFLGCREQFYAWKTCFILKSHEKTRKSQKNPKNKKSDPGKNEKRVRMNGSAIHSQHVFHFFPDSIFHFSDFLFLIIFHISICVICYPIFHETPIKHV